MAAGPERPGKAEEPRKETPATAEPAAAPPEPATAPPEPETAPPVAVERELEP